DFEAFLVRSRFALPVGLLEFADVAAVGFAQGIHVIAVAVHAGDFFFKAVDSGLIVAALQVIASLLERRLHGKLAAKFAFGILAESRTSPDRQREKGAGAQRHK